MVAMVERVKFKFDVFIGLEDLVGEVEFLVNGSGVYTVNRAFESDYGSIIVRLEPKT